MTMLVTVVYLKIINVYSLFMMSLTTVHGLFFTRHHSYSFQVLL